MNEPQARGPPRHAESRGASPPAVSGSSWCAAPRPLCLAGLSWSRAARRRDPPPRPGRRSRPAASTRTSGPDRLARSGGEGRRSELLVFARGLVEQLAGAVGVRRAQKPTAEHQATGGVEGAAEIRPALPRLVDRRRACFGVGRGGSRRLGLRRLANGVVEPAG